MNEKLCFLLATRSTLQRVFFFSSIIQNDPAVKTILRKTRGQPKKRLLHVYELCKKKRVCQGGEEMDKPAPTENETQVL